MTSGGLTTRLAAARDAPSIAAIYNEGVADRVATFETEPRTADQIAALLAGKGDRCPTVVVERDGRVVGWAGAGPYRDRPAYAGVAEHSVYVARAERGRGVGRAALDALCRACAERGFWKMVSRIFPENTASLAVHERCGFRNVGVYRRHGKLDGEWRDCVIVERLLGAQRVLFLCTHNSARSQMAEGWLRSMAGDRFEVASAGTEATRVHPLAVRAMSEVGVDLTWHSSKTLERFLEQPWDHVITVCDAANEACPVFPGTSRRLHWSFPDPSQATGTDDERLEVFRRVRDEIRGRLSAWIAAPPPPAGAATANRPGAAPGAWPPPRPSAGRPSGTRDATTNR
ncbi:MAG: arsinothricin resistance N-acetyltransferase ArsN1 family A [Candidatus Rokuibacteriota bacterium]